MPQDFMLKLVNHFLIHLLPEGIEVTDNHCGKLLIRDQSIFNYTAYDDQHDQDTTNPCQQSNIMILTNENDCSFHIYQYF